MKANSSIPMRFEMAGVPRNKQKYLNITVVLQVKVEKRL